MHVGPLEHGQAGVPWLLQAGKQHGLHSVPAPLAVMEAKCCESPEFQF